MKMISQLFPGHVDQNNYTAGEKIKAVREITSVGSKSHVKQCEYSEELRKMKEDGTNSYHCALRKLTSENSFIHILKFNLLSALFIRLCNYVQPRSQTVRGTVMSEILPHNTALP